MSFWSSNSLHSFSKAFYNIFLLSLKFMPKRAFLMLDTNGTKRPGFLMALQFSEAFGLRSALSEITWSPLHILIKPWGLIFKGRTHRPNIGRFNRNRLTFGPCVRQPVRPNVRLLSKAPKKGLPIRIWSVLCQWLRALTGVFWQGATPTVRTQ